jgi:hypothetical protein
MNISGYSDISSVNSYEARKASPAESESFSIPDDAPYPVSTPLVLASPDSFPSDFQSKIHSNSQDDYYTDSAYMQVDSQREYKAGNFLQEYVSEEEEDEDKKDERLIDYLLEALKGEEKELRMEGNSYMDEKVKYEYLQKNFPGLFSQA